MVSNIMLTLAFLVGVAAVYYLVPRRFRQWLLLLASMLFYVSAGPWMLVLSGGSALWSFYAGAKIEQAETKEKKNAHADGKEQVEGEDDDLDDDGNGHAQRGDNAAPVRPRPPSTFSRALRGDAEVADVAGDEGHVCLDHADDRKIGNGLHGPERL